jgi:AcrR family transcriptional regulator
LRERQKLERRTRIQRAAREIFEKVGFEATTMRDIAERAKVGIGTLFPYAEDKSDLLMAILGDDLDEITRKSLAEISVDGELYLSTWRLSHEFASPDTTRPRHDVATT